MLIQREWSHRLRCCLIFHVKSAFGWVGASLCCFLLFSVTYQKNFSKFVFFRFQQSLAQMLKRFSKRSWTEFHRKAVHLVSFLTWDMFDTQKWSLVFYPCILRPVASIDNPFKALVFDSNFDHYRGVVANIAVFGGRVRKGDKIVSAHLSKTYEVNELGLLRPDEHPTQKLCVAFFLLSCQFSYCNSWMPDMLVSDSQLSFVNWRPLH